MSVDPLMKEYPWYTPYQFAGNKPIWAIDIDGLEEIRANEYGQLYIHFQGDVTATHDPAPSLVRYPVPKVDKVTNVSVENLQISGTGIGGTLSAMSKGMEEVAQNFGNALTREYIKNNPDMFPEGLKGNKKLLDAGIENVVFYPSKGSGNAVGISKVKWRSVTDVGSTVKNIGNIALGVDIGLIAIDLVQGDNESALRNTVVLGASYYIHPVIGPVVALYDVTMARDKDKIYGSLARDAKKDFLKYSSSENYDYKKMNRALDRYKKFGGEECLDCGYGDTQIGPAPKKE